MNPHLDIPVPPSLGTQPGLLLVESDAAMRKLLIEVLSPHYQVEAVDGGLNAWQVARKHSPDVVVVSLYTPTLDGLTLIRCLRADEQMGQVPIVVLTVSHDRELLLRCLAAGANEFLLKPFRMSELLVCLQQKLGARNACAPTRS